MKCSDNLTSFNINFVVLCIFFVNDGKARYVIDSYIVTQVVY